MITTISPVLLLLLLSELAGYVCDRRCFLALPLRLLLLLRPSPLAVRGDRPAGLVRATLVESTHANFFPPPAALVRADLGRDLDLLGVLLERFFLRDVCLRPDLLLLWGWLRTKRELLSVLAMWCSILFCSPPQVCADSCLRARWNCLVDLKLMGLELLSRLGRVAGDASIAAFLSI